jgi:vacuolar-type H+-ATPase subunit E/Vma4
MAIEKLSAQIAQSAQEEAERITRNAQAAGAEVIKGAKSAAVQRKKAAEDEAKELVSTQRAERIAAAKLEAKKLIAHAQDEAVGASLQHVWSELKQFRRTKEYAKLLQSLASQALDELGDRDGIVYVNSEDQKLLSGMKNLSKKPIECAGGCVAESKGGSVRVNLTLEAIFESEQDGFRKKAYDSLFG